MRTYIISFLSLFDFFSLLSYLEPFRNSFLKTFFHLCLIISIFISESYFVSYLSFFLQIIILQRHCSNYYFLLTFLHCIFHFYILHLIIYIKFFISYTYFIQFFKFTYWLFHTIHTWIYLLQLFFQILQISLYFILFSYYVLQKTYIFNFIPFLFQSNSISTSQTYSNSHLKAEFIKSLQSH